MIISSYVDASILTISLNKVNKKMALECVKKLKILEQPIIGTIVNSVKEDNRGNFFSNNYLYGNAYNYYSCI